MSRIRATQINIHQVTLDSSSGAVLAYCYGPKVEGSEEFESREAAEEAYPLLWTKRRKREVYGEPMATADTDLSIPIPVARLIKAREAERVLFEAITDLDRLPFLAKRVARGEDLQDVAAEIWAKHIAGAELEDQRIQAKKDLRGADNIAILEDGIGG